MIFQVHEKHGRHVAQTPQEAESNRKRGWKDVSREEFYGPGLSNKSVPAIETSTIPEASTEAEKNNAAPAKKRGRPPKVRNGHCA